MRLLLVVSAIIATCTFTSQPASAHSTCKYPPYSNPPGGQTDVGCILDSHYTAMVGDNNCDGHRVYMRFYVRDIAQSNVLEDTNGCQPGVGTWRLLSPTTRFTVCTEGVRCTGYNPA